MRVLVTAQKLKSESKGLLLKSSDPSVIDSDEGAHSHILESMMERLAPKGTKVFDDIVLYYGSRKIQLMRSKHKGVYNFAMSKSVAVYLDLRCSRWTVRSCRKRPSRLGNPYSA